MIYTSYFAKVKNLPSNILAISISLSPPKGWKGPQYKVIAPTSDILLSWKENNDNELYIERFKKEVLEPLDVNNVVKILKQIAGKKDICLVCYEKPEDFCHRHLVADWLNENGFECKEYEF